MIGETVSHYRIAAELGAGGMGVVYRAEDLTLGRPVALKFLPASLARDAQANERFLREARSAAALNHPHICTIYEVGGHGDQPFIAMELLEGRTLGTQVAEGPLPVATVIEFGLQIAAALDAAHAKGIVHRDIKPANIFVTPGGVKVLDFGLAKAAPPVRTFGSPDQATMVADESTITGHGAALGTVAYMSPEQARGQDLDARTDLFSFGLVLYEMATGHQAFEGATTAVVFDRLLNAAPARPATLNPQVPLELEQIIAKAIEKDRALRYQSAADLATDLRRLRRSTDSGHVPALTTAATPAEAASVAASWGHRSAAAAAPPAVARRRWTLAGAVAAVAVVAALVAWQFRGAQALGEGDVILLADITNTTGDAMFDGTLKQAVAVKLEESPFLDVLSEPRVQETLRFMSRAPDTLITGEVAREICQRQGLRAILLGEIAPLGSHYVITLTAESCDGTDTLASEQVEADSKESVLASLGAAVTSMRGKLGESLASLSRMDTPIEQATTSSLEALKAFSLGDQARARRNDLDSIPFYARAIELDPEFALAYARLGTVYANSGELERAAQYRQRAFDLRARVSERERFYITAHYYNSVAKDPEQARTTYELWKQTYPRDSTPYINLGTIFSDRGQDQQALASYLEALEVDPRQRIAYTNAASTYLKLNRFDEARALLERQEREIGLNSAAELQLAQIAFVQGDLASVDARLTSVEQTSDAAAAYGMRSGIQLSRGRLADARRFLDLQIAALDRQGFRESALVARAGAAIGAAQVGDTDLARAYLAEVRAGEPGPIARLNVAIALAVLGDAAPARRIYEEVKPSLPASPVLDTLVDPTFEAVLAARAGDAGRVLDLLGPLEPNELTDGVGTFIISLRAEAYLQLERPAEAEAEFRKFLDHPEFSPMDVNHVVAHLGIARARALGGDVAGARQAYEAFFEAWKDADPDLPIVEQARAEYARLTPPE